MGRTTREFLQIPRSIWRPEKKLTSRCTKVTELTRSLTPRVSPLSVNAKTRDVTFPVQKSQLSLASRGRARFYNFNKSFTQRISDLYMFIFDRNPSGLSLL